MLAYGPYEPDVSDTAAGVSPVIQNVIPKADPQTAVAYKPFPSFLPVPGASAFPDTPRGGISIVNPSSGAYEVYLCSDSDIYQMQADYSWVSIGSGYSLPAEDEWTIIQFGDYLVFSNRSDGMLQYNVVSGGAITTIPNAPKARYLFVAFDCVFALDCDGENRLMRNSGTNDHTVWTPGKNNSQYQPIPDGQELIAGGAINDATAIIFQRNSIRILNRTNDARLYSMNKLAENIGCINGRTLASIGTELFFQGTDGFYRVNASGVTAIGAQRVNATYLADTDETNFFTVQAAVDPVNKLVIWMYHPADSVDDQYLLSNGFGYAYQIDKWFKLDFENEAQTAILGFYQFATPGYGMDSIDGFGSLDSLPYSLDSRFWNGGEPTFAGISSTGVFGFFNGTSMTADLWTQTLMADQSQYITWVTPVDDAGSGIVAVASRDNLYTAPTVKSVSTINLGGRAPVRARGKINQGRRTIASGTDWSYARGVDYIVASTGGFR